MTKRKAMAKVLSSEVVFKGRVFGVRRERVLEPGRVEATREIVTHRGSVVVLPVFADGRILMIRQYRHSVRQYLWELVAGSKDRGESFEKGAHRELQEETGYTARRMRKLLDLFPTPGFVSENMVIFLAEGLTLGKAHPEADEKIELRVFSLSEIEDWIRAGKIRDAKSVAGILYYAHCLRKKRRTSK
ncbi:MAG TPA: NUDIX hydrolase [Candidatus Acidoferrales bacterium]|jgi:ADP-ribose pyrophosphatase|nr:NUDIX hydrolase [Candidatus Acidoferrales bacterium]